jgi:hypothetical protein
MGGVYFTIVWNEWNGMAEQSRAIGFPCTREEVLESLFRCSPEVQEGTFAQSFLTFCHGVAR